MRSSESQTGEQSCKPSPPIAQPPIVRPKDGRALFFVVEPDRARLADPAQRVRDGRLDLRVGAVRPLAEAAAVFAPERRVIGRTITGSPMIPSDHRA